MKEFLQTKVDEISLDINDIKRTTILMDILYSIHKNYHTYEDDLNT